MPNRIIRPGLLGSQRIATLSAETKWTYIGLLLTVDDWGRREDDSEMIRMEVWPRDLDRMTVGTIESHIDNLANAGLLNRYSVNDKAFIELPRFAQPKRSKFSRCPPPPINSASTLVDQTDLHSTCIAHAKHVHSTCVASAQVVQPTQSQSQSHAHPVPREVGQEPDRKIPARAQRLEPEDSASALDGQFRVNLPPSAGDAYPAWWNDDRLNAALIALESPRWQYMSPESQRRLRAVIETHKLGPVCDALEAAAKSEDSRDACLAAALTRFKTETATRVFQKVKGDTTNATQTSRVRPGDGKWPTTPAAGRPATRIVDPRDA